LGEFFFFCLFLSLPSEKEEAFVCFQQEQLLSQWGVDK
jgi:hypothetical protein